MSQPPNGTIFAPDARCRALRGVFLRGTSVACSMWAARVRAEQVTVLCAFRHGQGTIEAPNSPAAYPPLTAEAVSTPATQLKTMTPAPMASAIGNSVPGPVNASTTHIATMAPTERLPLATSDSRLTPLVVSPTKAPAMNSNTAVNTTARPEFRNHGGKSPPGRNHSRQPTVRTRCAATNTTAPSTALFNRIMIGPC